jgi:hypothetical protein
MHSYSPCANELSFLEHHLCDFFSLHDNAFSVLLSLLFLLRWVWPILTLIIPGSSCRLSFLLSLYPLFSG